MLNMPSGIISANDIFANCEWVTEWVMCTSHPTANMSMPLINFLHLLWSTASCQVQQFFPSQSTEEYKKLHYRQETHMMLCISWNVVLLLYEYCKQIMCQPKEHFQQLPQNYSATCIVFTFVHESLHKAQLSLEIERTDRCCSETESVTAQICSGRNQTEPNHTRRSALAAADRRGGRQVARRHGDN